MKFIWKLLTLTTAAGAGAAAMFFFTKNKPLKDPLDCGLYLSIGRKKLIKHMNEEIAGVEERTSAQNHAKRQKELETMDWGNNTCQS